METVTPLRPRPSRGRPPGRRAGRTAIIVAAVIVLLIVLVKALGFYAEWLWFGELSLRVVFWRSFWWRVLAGATFGALFFVIVYANLEIARRLAPEFRASESGDLIEFGGEVVRRIVTRVGLAVSLVAAVLAGIAASTKWLTFLKALNGVAFGQKDPVFHHDLGFYVFSLPAWHYLQGFLLAAGIVALLLSAGVHLLMGGIRYTYSPAAKAGAPRPNVDVRLDGKAVAHLCALLAFVFVVTGIGQLFKAWNLLYSSSGTVFGAGYTDVHVRLPIIRVLMVIAFLLAAALIANIWRRRQYWPAAVGVWIVVLILLQGIVPAIVQSLVVNPNQLAKERQYIGYNIKATQGAYDLAAITSSSLPMRTSLTAADLQSNAATIRNIRLWDSKTLVTSYKQIQELRPYYSFLDADVDRYMVNGVYRQTMLSPRELNISGLPSAAQTWVNQHITYTHGFGVAVSAVNQVTADGSPDFLVQNIPPVSAPGLEITQPRIYYGELGTDYALVKTKDQEFDYPGPNGDVYQSYGGSGGIPISSFVNRLAFCVRFGTIKFFTASAIDSQSRIIVRNTHHDRIKAAAPFLKPDSDPYMVIAGGRLFWIVDCYTTTDLYPYSTRQGGVNYIRNSVKAVIDAYNGTVDFYVFDPSDPLLRTYAKIFPGMFKSADQMPAALRAHVRYPEDYFNTQAAVWATYHVSNPDVLYNKGDQWQIPTNVSLSGAGPMDAYYVIMRLPGTQKEEFLLMLPYVPNGRSNMISWLGARCDAPNYGQAVNYVFTKSTSVYGPAQVEAAINQDPDVSSQRTLWGQQGSQVIMGNLLVVPVQDQLLYVQPLFLQGEQTPLPQLKRVIVFYRSPAPEGASQAAARQVVVMRPTLGECLAAVFGGAAATPGTTGQPISGVQPPTSTVGLSAQARALIAKANSQFEAAQQALKKGDWAGYGQDINALKLTLQKLQTAQ
jgi:uncharacterized membrane protein (UPF0182 family)